MIRNLPLKFAVSVAVLAVGLAAATPSAYAADPKVGVTSMSNGGPLGKPPTMNQRVLHVGIDVMADERITTAAADQAHVLFLDGTALTVGPNSDLVVDKFVFDPNAGTGALAMSATKGLFRLVGGKVTKTGEAQMKVNGVTVGIRGGIAIIDASKPNKVDAYFLFGQQLTVEGGGVKQVATRPGSMISTPSGAPPAAPILIPAGSLVSVLPQLEAQTQSAATNPSASSPSSSSSSSSSGQPGSGGANASDGGNTNSGYIEAQTGALAPINGETPVAPPVPAPALANVGTTSGVPPSTSNIVANSAPPPPPLPPTPLGAEGRYLRWLPYLPGTFSTATLFADRDPAHNMTLQSAVLNGTQNRLTITAADNSVFDLPVSTYGSFFTVNTASSNGPFGGLTGSGYVAPDKSFYIFSLQEPGNGNNSVVLSGGTLSTALPSTGFGLYNITSPTAGAFWAPQGVTGSLPLINSPMYSVFTGASDIPTAGTTDARQRLLQASIGISGMGAAQRSYLGVMVGGYFTDETKNNSPYAGGVYVGFQRVAAGGPLARYTSLEATQDSQNGNGIYGPNGSYMVFVNDTITTATTGTTRQNGAGFNSPAANVSGSTYYRPTLAVLDSNPTSLGPRTTQTLNGYAAGFGEHFSGSTLLSQSYTNSDPTKITIFTNASTNRLQSTFDLIGDQNPSSTRTFRFGNTTGVAGASSAFIADNLFGARQSNTTSSSYSESGGPINVLARIEMVSSGVVPGSLNNITPSGVTLCNCEYLTWGYWQGEVFYNSGPLSGRSDRIQLGTWVTGTLPTQVEIPNTGTATYSGNVVGNVVNGSDRYVAVGGFSQSWNFGSRSGNVAISNFDGNNLNGTVSAPVGTPRDFAGSLSSSTNPSLNGSLNGSFFKGAGDPTKAVGGNFNLAAPNYKATGTFMGQKP